MEHSKNISFYDICRLCLDKPGSRDVLKDQCLSVHIYNCIGIKISINDNLPPKICANCLEIVNKATELRIAAKSNEFNLKSLFSDNESGHLQGSSKKSSLPISSCCKKETYSNKTSPAIEKFISVRKDLFISSVSEDSIVQTDAPQVHSSQVPISNKRQKFEDGNTEYQCSICLKKFDKWKKLYLHDRLHNKNYGCPMCAKMFSTKGDVEKHIRTHTGDKPYHCEYCDKSFSQRGSLKSHKESIHSVG